MCYIMVLPVVDHSLCGGCGDGCLRGWCGWFGSWAGEYLCMILTCVMIHSLRSSYSSICKNAHCVCVCVYECVSTSIGKYVWLCVYVNMRSREYTCVYEWMYTFIHTWTCVYESICVYQRIHMYHAYEWTNAFIDLYMHVSENLYLCMCVYACACIHERGYNCKLSKIYAKLLCFFFVASKLSKILHAYKRV